MRIIEIVLAVIMILAMLMRVNHIPGGIFIFMLAAQLLSMLYFLSFLLLNGIRARDMFKREAYADVTAGKMGLAVLVGLGLSAVIIGSLFKLMFWPGAAIMLTSSLVYTGVFTAIAVMYYLSSKQAYNMRLFKRVFVIGGLALLLFFTHTNTLVDLFHGNQPEYAALYKKVLADPDNEELRTQLHEMEIEMRLKEFRSIPSQLPEDTTAITH